MAFVKYWKQGYKKHCSNRFVNEIVGVLREKNVKCGDRKINIERNSKWRLKQINKIDKKIYVIDKNR